MYQLFKEVAGDEVMNKTIIITIIIIISSTIAINITVNAPLSGHLINYNAIF